MDRGKIVRRPIKRPDPCVWFAKNLSRACASHNLVEPRTMGEKRLHLRDRWMKRRRRFHQTQEELSSPVADLDLLPPSSTTDNLLPSPHTVAIQPPLSQTVVDLDKVAELPLVTVEDLTPPASTSPTEMVSSRHDVPGQNMYFTWQRKRKQSKNCKDIISSLPDDILIHIISLLDLREAATTSVLSKRWRYVWATLSNLDFDGLSTLNGRGYSTRYESDACKYVHRVNQVVSSSLAPRIRKFRIRFLLGASYGYDIHTWVNFAMRKNVKELELNFSSCLGVGPEDPFYIDSFRCYARYPSAHSLVSLSLSGLSIGGYFFESVLFNFPNLECLTMKHSYCGQSKLNFVGDLLKLRHLEISYCYDYKELEISAGNLISFVYFGGKQNVKFSYVPLLNEVSVSGSHSLHTIRSLQNSGFLPQLTKLKLHMVQIQDFIRSPIRFPQCGNLKQLDFTFFDGAYHSLLIFTNLIDACPVLHKFKLQRNFNEPYAWYYRMISRGNVIKVAEKHHHCLKIFEMVGFRGNPVDIELVLYLARFAIVFEKVILDLHLPIDGGKPSERNTCEQIEASRKQAKLLQNQLPARVLVEVL